MAGDGRFKHPDFIVTLNGRDVTGDVAEWRVRDLEDGMSSLQVKLDNRDMKYSGSVNVNDVIAIRFGHFGNLSAKVEMDVRKYLEHYSTGGLHLNITGLDATHKLSKKTGRGHHKSKKPKRSLEEIAKEVGVKIDTSKLKEPQEEGTEKKSDCQRQPLTAGTTALGQAQSLVDRCEPQGSGGSSSVFDSKDDANSGGEKKLFDNTDRATGVVPDKKADKNRLKNAKNRAKSSGITGQLMLIGYPLLQAKKCLTLVNVGSQASGKWYVKSCDHAWSRNNGYVTQASLMRPGTGKGGDGGEQPNVLYADIWKGKDQIFAGPRPIDSESQATLTFGDGSYIHSFDFSVDGQTGRSTGKDVDSRTINPNKVKKPVRTVSTKKDS